MATSPNLLITHIAVAQAQKEVTANTAFDALEKAITEQADISVAGAVDVTLTLAQMQNAVIKFTGVLTASINVIVPLRDKIYIIHNGTTGAFTLKLKTSSGAGVIIEQGFKAILYCNGTDVLDLSGAFASARTVTGSVTLRDTDQLVFADATGGNVTATLPAASTYVGKSMRIIRVDASANTVTVQRAGADTINGATSKTIANTPGTGLALQGYTTSAYLAQTLTAA